MAVPVLDTVRPHGDPVAELAFLTLEYAVGERPIELAFIRFDRANW
jgi:hypothetical protein